MNSLSILMKRFKKNIENWWHRLSDYEKRLIIFIGVYLILASKLTISMLYSMEETFDSCSNIFVRVLYLYVCPLIYFLSIRMAKNKIEDRYDTNSYYEMKLPGENRLRYAKRNEIYETIKYVIIIFVVLWAAVMFITYVDKDTFIITYESMRTIFLDESPISTIIGMVAFVLALFQWVLSYLDKKCKFFSVDDLPSVNRSKNYILTSVIYLFFYIIFYFIYRYNIWDKEWLYAIEILGMIIFSVTTFTCICLFYMQVYPERRVVNNIERYFPVGLNVQMPHRAWKQDEAVEILIQLVNKYVNSIKKIDVNQIEDIKFGCVLEDDGINKEYAVSNYYKLVIMGYVFLMLFFKSTYGLIPSNLFVIYMIIMIVGTLPIIELCIDKNRICMDYKRINDIVYSSKWGYYVRLSNQQKNIYINSYTKFFFSYTSRRYREYILNIKRIACFYNLASMIKYEDKRKFKRYGMESLFDYVEDMYHRKEDIRLMIIPILVCACLYEKKLNKSKKNDEVKNKVKSIIARAELNIGDNDIENKTKEISYLVLRDIYGDDRIFEKEKYRTKIDSYFEVVDVAE